MYVRVSIKVTYINTEICDYWSHIPCRSVFYLSTICIHNTDRLHFVQFALNMLSGEQIQIVCFHCCEVASLSRTCIFKEFCSMS